MKPLLALALVIGTTGPPMLQAAHQGPPIRIRIYNHAGFDGRAVIAAQRKTAGILSAAGIASEWVGCSAPPTDTAKIVACAMPPGRTDIVLNLLSDATFRQDGVTAETFGFAVAASPQGPGTATIFVRRAERLAFHGPFSVSYEYALATVLGHVIAHEIGHLLLGPGKHSFAGLMSARWSEKEMRRLAKGYLPFSVEEAGVIRSRLEGLRESDAAERARDGRATE